ncbi:MAG: tRNA (adenosine(37)-N6)-dimethylallyltransferase MiaA [Gemmatimonadetes bacterium]|uniref:tRNA dimethylallyltransferase n=1 Tax=Candidatus Kutchimonas denitrificans TaxID=3056748 RepID=A0AAE4ZBP3_9BACT|nr:tRNA (adenosine(37)-N6)-dimethylallyltransferase MiaA [Gemmatimonadota bacterium]NIR76026.1 tRNA (adenosine(37)-N6)-dimethylallyltransferase MiaA [Candidatus Kutchimonas denitrificans]NIS02218.1 tRNA (adenosine(37)-N6)-dimethylallyltransferase MiaA [Gemmatimonadota bacterium]NIT68044.1 tRNA (adenosine(37)-N6)-dimethylallyltransferase MiaA [Gemmatimonadota bacterium]NIU54070.1 tRNA (adenosine(37)-N6)-dimethylallyltransferase MiaA [Gemmatimonadota bacterium]
MTQPAAARALVITGPTGSGKSDLAVAVAEAIGGAIISADSRQIYRDMEIGTASPSPRQRARVPHFGLDLLAPTESYSAGRFARDAWSWIEEIEESGAVPIIAGGTGFFIRALLDPLGPEPRVDRERRAELRHYLAGLAPDELERWLVRLDPERASQLAGEGGGQRLGRSLEVTLLSGRPHSSWLERPPPTARLEARVFCLELPREALYRRLDARFDRMLAEGLLDEVRRLVERYGPEAPGLDSVGYAELVRHLRGACSLEEAIEEAKRKTRRLAKRQLTWFRHQLPEGTVRLDATHPAEELVAQVVGAWRGSAPDARSADHG